jgi:NAD+ diphosphatase
VDELSGFYMAQTLNLPLSISLVDRKADLRTNQSLIAELFQEASVLIFQNGKVGIPNEFAKELKFFKGSELGGYESQTDYYLGDIGSESFFVRHLPNASAFNVKISFAALREFGAQLDKKQIGLAVQAQGLANWHEKHPRCSICGGPTLVTSAGAIRKCPQDDSEHYPRTDSAIIVLVKDKSDRILLGRQSVWPQNRFSTFAGFVEPGESFENCVIREVKEEAGVIVSQLKYLGSQPWPFPSSLMVAFEAITNAPETAKPDGVEIEQLRWFNRSQIAADFADKKLLLPPKISVARAMIENWYCSAGLDAKDLGTGESWR